MSYQLKVYFYTFFILLEILYANTNERLYGLELTFTNKKMISETLSPTQKKTQESEMVLNRLKNAITAQLQIR